MKNSRFVLFILIVSLAACLAVAFSACDMDDVSDEDLLVAGQEDLSMYETKSRIIPAATCIWLK